MKECFIEKYIQKLTINDINNFSLKNNIILNENEKRLIYNYIKKDWKIIIYGNPISIFNELKRNIKIEEYNKIEKLYYIYKNKYKNLL